MKFALFDNEKIEAKVGIEAKCQGCLQPVIAKCGNIRIHHWSHKRKVNCDNWWETETEWHRNWKNKFPIDWQETVFTDEKTSEKHIADVCTDKGFVVEFQHSYINVQERISRETFYKNLVWVVDGTRLKSDYTRFLNERINFINFKNSLFYVYFVEETFNKNWIESKIPIVFDFLGLENENETVDYKKFLYCLFPIRLGTTAIVAEISRSAFIKSIHTGEWLTKTENFIKEIIQIIKEKEALELKRKNEQYSNYFHQMYLARKPVKRRRF
jgi:competence CoiA-like predicted nuclease